MDVEYNGPERRQFKRVRTSLNVMFSTEGPLEISIKNERGEFAATMVDICEGGFSILTGVKLDVPSLIWIKFTLLRPNGNKVSYEFFGLVECLGEVRDTISLSDTCYRAGIAFMQIEDECRKAIEHFIQCVESGGARDKNGENANCKHKCEKEINKKAS
ncbi:MAG: PilZ domain-containing protein [Candidatus Omnitrophica bacterium]|nr:PilZ domain-containing protein [Candidatus Omnitrophota bacterium]